MVVSGITQSMGSGQPQAGTIKHILEEERVPVDTRLTGMNAYGPYIRSQRIQIQTPDAESLSSNFHMVKFSKCLQSDKLKTPKLVKSKTHTLKIYIVFNGKHPLIQFVMFL